MTKRQRHSFTVYKKIILILKQCQEEPPGGSLRRETRPDQTQAFCPRPPGIQLPIVWNPATSAHL
ncbi:hypothetical protein A6R68_21177 [Neotoma lepida]|uniref:Uncharacterized protein n=1 Tax=Neotoma lepida TaxID=56216 RepID=A0A1A6HQW0_NEOLE|nr:hypothetical protein A6R68_21177 [Neotoma lepida]